MRKQVCHHRVGRNNERGRHEEELLPLADVIECDEAPLTDIHPLYLQLLRGEAGGRQPPLQRGGALQGLDLAAPGDDSGLGASEGIARRGGDGASDPAADDVSRGGGIGSGPRRRPRNLRELGTAQDSTEDLRHL